jgi:hypothetical protein
MSLKRFLITTSLIAITSAGASFAQAQTPAPGAPAANTGAMSGPGGRNTNTSGEGGGVQNPNLAAPSTAPSVGLNGTASPPMAMHHTRTGHHRAMRGGHASVRQAQTALKDKGLYDGTVDGMMGPKTHAALKQYQSQNNLKQNAQLDRATMRSLRGGSMKNSMNDNNSGSMNNSRGMSSQKASPDDSMKRDSTTTNPTNATPGTTGSPSNGNDRAMPH